MKKYLTLWVALCIVAGIIIGNSAGEYVHFSHFEIFGVNIPVAILVWLMIYPMMLLAGFHLNFRQLLRTVILSPLRKVKNKKIPQRHEDTKKYMIFNNSVLRLVDF